MNNDTKPRDVTENDRIIGLNVRRLRRAAHPILSQAALANHLGITFQQIQKYESGANRIAASRIPHIAAFVGCEIVDLFEGTEARA